jgi:two-component system nitrate/nitrite response regulator NarL
MIVAMQTDSNAAPGPSVVLRITDPLRHRQLERALAHLVQSEADADVMVVHLVAGQKLPPEAGSFDGALLVLTDNPALAADPALQGVLPAAAPALQVEAAIAALAAGLTVRLPGQPDRSGFAPPEAASRPLLTPRELEVLALVGEGMSNKTIARRLGISAHTVKYHLEAVFTKLAVRSRAEAVTRGLRHGLLVV